MTRVRDYDAEIYHKATVYGVEDSMDRVIEIVELLEAKKMMKEIHKLSVHKRRETRANHLEVKSTNSGPTLRTSGGARIGRKHLTPEQREEALNRHRQQARDRYWRLKDQILREQKQKREDNNRLRIQEKFTLEQSA